MSRDGKMDAHLDVPINGFAGRLEVIAGPTGRRQRSQADKARIVAESLVPGVRVAEVARKYGVTRWQVYDWRKRLRGNDEDRGGRLGTARRDPGAAARARHPAAEICLPALLGGSHTGARA